MFDIIFQLQISPGKSGDHPGDKVSPDTAGQLEKLMVADINNATETCSKEYENKKCNIENSDSNSQTAVGNEDSGVTLSAESVNKTCVSETLNGENQGCDKNISANVSCVSDTVCVNRSVDKQVCDMQENQNKATSCDVKNHNDKQTIAGSDLDRGFRSMAANSTTFGCDNVNQNNSGCISRTCTDYGELDASGLSKGISDQRTEHLESKGHVIGAPHKTLLTEPVENQSQEDIEVDVVNIESQNPGDKTENLSVTARITDGENSGIVLFNPVVCVNEKQNTEETAVSLKKTQHVHFVDSDKVHVEIKSPVKVEEWFPQDLMDIGEKMKEGYYKSVVSTSKSV